MTYPQAVRFTDAPQPLGVRLLRDVHAYPGKASIGNWDEDWVFLQVGHGLLASRQVHQFSNRQEGADVVSTGAKDEYGSPGYK